MTSQTSEFQDDWGDLSPSFEDQLSQHTSFLESVKNLKQQSVSTSNSRGIQPQRHRPAFQVYRDAPYYTNCQSIGLQKRQPLKERQLNQDSLLVASGKQKGSGNEARRHDELQNPPKTILSSKQHAAVATRNAMDDDAEFDLDDDDMWMQLDMSAFSKVESSILSTNGKDQTGSPSANLQDQRIQQNKVESNINQFGGFVTGGSKKKLESTADARTTALSLFNDIPGDKIPASTRRQTEEPTFSNPMAPNIPSGFTTGRGNPVKAASSGAIQRAERRFEDSRNGNELPTTLHSSVAEDNLLDNPRCGEKRPAQEELPAEFKYENVLSQYGGFLMGSGRAGISVSAEAKRQAVALFNSDSTCQDLTQSTQMGIIDSQTQQPPGTPERLNSSPARSLESSPEKDSLQSATEKSASQEKIPPLQLRNRRITALRGKMKPFKSPIIEANLEKTKEAMNKKFFTVRCKGDKVFDMQCPVPRYPLSKLGPPRKTSVSELEAKNMPKDILFMTAHMAESYTFDGWGPKDARKELIKAGALERLLPPGWVENHYRWIVWKIASMIRSYPDEFADWWAPRKITDQLLYRYEREVNMGHRSALKRIIEQDDIPTKHMILVVADIFPMRHPQQQAVIGEAKRQCQLLLTDGWYSIPALVDSRMERAISKGRLRIGQKLSICGAQLIGNREAKSPLNANYDTQLQISSNSCQPAAWDAKLGYQRQRVLFRPLSSIHVEGGLVTSIDVVICRKYQVFYTETLPNGTTITRSTREEEDYRQHFLGDMGSFNDFNGSAPPNFQEDSSSSLSPWMERSGDNIIYKSRRANEERNVSAYFRVRVCDYAPKPKAKANQDTDATSMMLLITNANEVTFMDICEGARYKIYFVVPFMRKKDSSIELKTTRSTRWEMVPSDPSDEGLTKAAYTPRHTIPCCSIPFINHATDIDLVGVLLYVSEPRKETFANNRVFWYQSLILSDETTALCHLSLRLPARPLPNVNGQVVAFLNLRFDMYDAKYNVTHLKWSEESEVCSQQNLASNHLQRSMRNMREWIRSHPNNVQALHARVQSLLNQN